MRLAPKVGLGVAGLLLAESSVLARVASMSLADLVQHSAFIGIVRVDRVTGRIPLIRRRLATATVLEGWKGQHDGVVSFVAQATWTCDVSDAEQGEVAIVFIHDRHLVHSGRGKMPIFTREGRRLAAVWPDVRLPKELPTEDGPEPDDRFMRGVAVSALASAVERQAHTPAGEAE